MTQPRSQTLAASINSSLAGLMEVDDRIVLLGEDIGRLGGVFRVTRGLQARFGADRVRDTTLAESSIVGQAIGMSLSGLLPICEIQFDGFCFPAANQLITQAARLRGRWGGTDDLHLVVRIPSGGGTRGVEHHSESNESIFAAVPGLRVAYPSTGEDHRAVIDEALATPGPVLLYEPIRLYWKRVPPAPAAVPPRNPMAVRTLRPGADVTLVTYGAMTLTALAAAEEVAGEVDVEVLDLRWISPIDHEGVLESVRRTGRLLVVQESCLTHGVGAEVAATVAEHAFTALKAPVRRMGAPHEPMPPANDEYHYVVQQKDIVQALLEVAS
ncbi:alpha-ketoacid dehydrogenase subunit beta [Micromonospora sp. CP22]|uniref:alpha-ketoacid dehydrogenase subunit beta n=1 Tax=Micromonospora sp. CP22 TaxID=2580517 RepID=UPI0012BBFDE5|nr:transketolase C-terminal domain-containing protein [Micromonospora sp. CP22]MTK01197.1 pyruvate dehydrogenase [Micromonospora sp. CP22]